MMDNKICFCSIKKDGKRWYELTAPLSLLETGIEGYEFANDVIKLTKKGALSLKKGFRWNGRSGGAIDTVSALRSSAFHDALYELIWLNVLPRQTRVLADRMMRMLDAEDGVNVVRQWYSYALLRAFGDLRSKYIAVTLGKKHIKPVL